MTVYRVIKKYWLNFVRLLLFNWVHLFEPPCTLINHHIHCNMFRQVTAAIIGQWCSYMKGKNWGKDLCFTITVTITSLWPVITFLRLSSGDWLPWVKGLGAVRAQFTCRAVCSPDRNFFLFAHLSTTPRISTEHRCDGLPSRGRLVCRIDRLGDGTDVLVWSVSCKFGFWFVVSKMTCLGHFIVHTMRRPAGQDQGGRRAFFHCKFL